MKVRILIPPMAAVKAGDVVEVEDHVAQGWIRGRLAEAADAAAEAVAVVQDGAVKATDASPPAVAPEPTMTPPAEAGGEQPKARRK